MSITVCQLWVTVTQKDKKSECVVELCALLGFLSVIRAGRTDKSLLNGLFHCVPLCAPSWAERQPKEGRKGSLMSSTPTKARAPVQQRHCGIESSTACCPIRMLGAALWWAVKEKITVWTQEELQRNKGWSSRARLALFFFYLLAHFSILFDFPTL